MLEVVRRPKVFTKHAAIAKPTKRETEKLVNGSRENGEFAPTLLGAIDCYRDRASGEHGLNERVISLLRQTLPLAGFETRIAIARSNFNSSSKFGVESRGIDAPLFGDIGGDHISIRCFGKSIEARFLKVGRIGKSRDSGTVVLQKPIFGKGPRDQRTIDSAGNRRLKSVEFRKPIDESPDRFCRGAKKMGSVPMYALAAFGVNPIFQVPANV